MKIFVLHELFLLMIFGIGIKELNDGNFILFKSKIVTAPEI